MEEKKAEGIDKKVLKEDKAKIFSDFKPKKFKEDNVPKGTEVEKSRKPEANKSTVMPKKGSKNKH